MRKDLIFWRPGRIRGIRFQAERNAHCRKNFFRQNGFSITILRHAFGVPNHILAALKRRIPNRRHTFDTYGRIRTYAKVRAAFPSLACVSEDPDAPQWFVHTHAEPDSQEYFMTESGNYHGKKVANSKRVCNFFAFSIFL